MADSKFGLCHSKMSSQSSTILWLACHLTYSAILLGCLINNEAVVATEEKPVNITYNVDKNAEFTCTVPNLGRRTLVWRRMSDPYPISVGGSRFSPDRRYSATKVDSSTYKLVIRDVGVRDAGEYECRVSGEDGMAEIITLNVRGGPNRPYLKQTETEVKAEEGNTVLLPCEVENLGSKMVLWANEKREMITLRKKNLIGDRNFRVVHDTAPQWSLRIQKVEKKHYGAYTCIINSNPVITRTVILKRTVEPKFSPKLIKDSHYKLTTSAKVGERVTLTCNFRANPRAKVSWYTKVLVGGKYKKKVLGEGNTLTLLAVSAEQSGMYFCVGKNGMDPNGRGRTKLEVIVPTTVAAPTVPTTVLVPTGPVSPHMYHRGLKVDAMRGHSAILTCTAIAQPRAYIHWYRHGGRLSNDHKYEITSKSYDRYNTTSTLNIHTVSSRDYGEYKCNGYNQLGVQTLIFEVTKA